MTLSSLKKQLEREWDLRGPSFGALTAVCSDIYTPLSDLVGVFDSYLIEKDEVRQNQLLDSLSDFTNHFQRQNSRLRSVHGLWLSLMYYSVNHNPTLCQKVVEEIKDFYDVVTAVMPMPDTKPNNSLPAMLARFYDTQTLERIPASLKDSLLEMMEHPSIKAAHADGSYCVALGLLSQGFVQSFWTFIDEYPLSTPQAKQIFLGLYVHPLLTGKTPSLSAQQAQDVLLHAPSPLAENLLTEFSVNLMHKIDQDNANHSNRAAQWLKKFFHNQTNQLVVEQWSGFSKTCMIGNHSDSSFHISHNDQTNQTHVVLSAQWPRLMAPLLNTCDLDHPYARSWRQIHGVLHAIPELAARVQASMLHEALEAVPASQDRKPRKL